MSDTNPWTDGDSSPGSNRGEGSDIEDSCKKRSIDVTVGTTAGDGALAVAGTSPAVDDWLDSDGDNDNDDDNVSDNASSVGAARSDGGCSSVAYGDA